MFDESHYSELLPETNSRNMYTGPGTGSMVAAAGEWQHMIEEVSSGVVEPFGEILQRLQEQCSGPSARRMHNAATQFLSWLRRLEKQLEVTHQQTAYLCTAYANAHRAMVSPAAITDNRADRDKLATTNQLGLNTPAIADLDAQYTQYGNRAVAVMRRYELLVLSALSAMTPWQQPPPITSGA
ncbi:PPE family protein [Mycobacterium haemophilum]|uniref:PPE domain-containing protein n=1 Tax=Mycobacterium haemophilum TaxID=29311 RepID=A0A0I9UQD6_9MYCO|nr:PPE family protein [Mycobacterium haemophilum]KLO33387.1 hypothetical protein ABH39_00520 [Mycobacterium haemophilum]KLO38910.1 hypothetical protein ABH38_00520 [Mycobacterium haemophilum]KLO45329.1 hypothetical protein ABH37_00520 [Mycobacterium haemophilum]KLO56478.1 hypothetical protein ABH36_00520 [Mycobacterium haemophilum]